MIHICNSPSQLYMARTVNTETLPNWTHQTNHVQCYTHIVRFPVKYYTKTQQIGYPVH